MGYVKLTCPACGANLQLENGFDTYYCPYCGVKFELSASSNAKLKARVRIKEIEAKSASEDKKYAYERYKMEYESREKDKDDRRFWKNMLIFFAIFCLGPILAIAIYYGVVALNHPGEIKMPSSYSQCIGENYNNVVDNLESLGFTNIKVTADTDLITGWITKDGEVETISINGDTSFTSDDYFPPDARINITYHTFKE